VKGKYGEPLFYDEGHKAIYDNEGNCFLDNIGDTEEIHRLVAAYNACDGIDPEKLGAVLAASQAALGLLNEMHRLQGHTLEECDDPMSALSLILPTDFCIARRDLARAFALAVPGSKEEK
jgi:hypothetical protein